MVGKGCMFQLAGDKPLAKPSILQDLPKLPVLIDS